MANEWVYDLTGKEVVFTGDIDGYPEEHLAEIALGLGASRVKEWINKSTTDVLVRGWSGRWKYGNFGKKEKQVAEMQSAGHRIRIIDETGFFGLRSGIPAPAMTPNVPESAARQVAAKGGAVGAPYRPGQFKGQLQGDGEHYRDPDVMERGLQAHSNTQDSLAKLLTLRGLVPLSPFDRLCNFDLAWQWTDGTFGIAEVKSNTVGNEAFQIRHGLGQVLDYGHRINHRGFASRLFLVLEREPEKPSHWTSLCSAHDVKLTWAPAFYGVE
ncbi:hypothetical protein J2W14_002364 [Pseudarthrobacter oxydans]|uniref:hypothetical protein n=1 Tax=Pseudarthrobacter oxydans TaxID=1671 RepID=UPI00277DCED7|nr:hypothetical protein [Pseudarthrobacter oxydans]MDP9982962.1 hypothetical protein [Pseudarthrobacter oxydans]